VYSKFPTSPLHWACTNYNAAVIGDMSYLHHHHQRPTDAHVCQIYDAIIDRVLADLTPLLDTEGMSTEVVNAIRQLWKEKLAVYGVGGTASTDFRGPMRAVAAHEYGHAGPAQAGHVYANMVNMGNMGNMGAMPAMEGLPHMMRPQALPPLSDLLPVRVKQDYRLGQTDGQADEETSTQFPFQCPAAQSCGRLPRKGDVSEIDSVFFLVRLNTKRQEVILCMNFESSDCRHKNDGSGPVSSIEQVDGLGTGPKRQKTGEDTYHQDAGDDLDDEEDGGEAPPNHMFCYFLSF